MNLTRIISIRERIATSSEWKPDERDFILESINTALVVTILVGPSAVEPGEIDGLYGRMSPGFQRLVRKIADAPNYDFAAMELLDAFEIEWRKP
jgi:hypothetical protein